MIPVSTDKAVSPGSPKRMERAPLKPRANTKQPTAILVLLEGGYSSYASLAPQRGQVSRTYWWVNPHFGQVMFASLPYPGSPLLPQVV